MPSSLVELPPVERFTSSSGARIYRLPSEAFPGFIVYVYLVFEAGPLTLVDAGSGYGSSIAQILTGLETVRAEFGEPFEPADIRRHIITHGHIDHFGGLAALRESTGAEVCIHGLDRWVLSHYEERVIVATKALRNFLISAGVPQDLQPDLMEMYGFSKKHVRSVPVDFVLHDGQELDGMRVVHTPGHCPGQVCLILGNILLSADHILARTSPHQAPESITAYTGLGHYLHALAKIRELPGLDLALGGHEWPVENVYARIDEIRASHLRKLDRVRQAIAESEAPATVNDVTQKLYPRVEGFNVLLAIEEMGAHVEYLYQHGELRVDNLDEVEREDNPPLRYRLA
jgi:glyoxylase-like metal-dependent hydrolase (beta-lactamase superfamily II)